MELKKGGGRGIRKVKRYHGVNRYCTRDSKLNNLQEFRTETALGINDFFWGVGVGGGR